MNKKFGPTIKKLQNAINSTGKRHLLVNKTQYYVEQDNKIAEILVVKEAFVNKKTGSVRYEEVFSSGSDIAITLFLRDVWYELNGWEVPTDNDYWEEVKRKYKVRQENRKKKAHGKQ